MISFISVIKCIRLLLFVLIRVAFFTLIERKVLGFIQLRKGPSKTGFWGTLQPFSDAIKLFLGELNFRRFLHFRTMLICPILTLIVSLICWLCVPFVVGEIRLEIGILFFLVCISLRIYSTVGSGWFSNSKYSVLGSLRGVTQTISYEVCLAVLLLSVIFFTQRYDLCILGKMQSRGSIFLLFMFPLSQITLVTILAETHRTPFDFSEGESELVSGFNTEYGRGRFSLFFIGEYASIILISIIFLLFFLGFRIGNLLSRFCLLQVIFLFIWVRGTLPRYRYDKLIALAWVRFLPLSLFFLIVSIYISSFITIMF